MNFCRVIDLNVALFPTNVKPVDEYKFIVDLVDNGFRKMSRKTFKGNIKKFFLTFFYNYNHNLPVDNRFGIFISLYSDWVHFSNGYRESVGKCVIAFVDIFMTLDKENFI